MQVAAGKAERFGAGLGHTALRHPGQAGDPRTDLGQPHKETGCRERKPRDKFDCSAQCFHEMKPEFKMHAILYRSPLALK